MYMDYLEIIGTLTGLIYLWLEYRASIYLWVVSIIMPAIYLVVYYHAGLYADCGIQIYFLLASLYGWICWMTRGKHVSSVSDGDTDRITHFRMKDLPKVCGVFLLLFLLIGYVLTSYTDSTVPWPDSFTTAASIIAMWMLAHKYAEQWLVWIMVDVASSALYVYKELYFTAVLYALYAVAAVYGYRNWIKLIKSQDHAL